MRKKSLANSGKLPRLDRLVKVSPQKIRLKLAEHPNEMRADVLQAVAICYHGCTVLPLPPSERGLELLGNHSLFRNVFELKFERGGKVTPYASGLVATGTGPWLRKLQSEGVVRLRLCLQGCAFGPTGQAETPWGVLTDGDVGLELWQPTWKGRFARFTEATMWNVVYRSSRFNRWSLIAPPSPQQAFHALRDALDQAAKAAVAIGAADVEPLARRCCELQEERSLICPGFPDLFGATTSEEARVLGSAALRAVMVMSSNAWTEALIMPSAPPFIEASHLVWKSALAAFESCAMVDAIMPQAA